MARNRATRRQRHKVFRKQKRKSEKRRRKSRNHRRNTRKNRKNRNRSSKKSNSSRSSNHSYQGRYVPGTRFSQESIHSDDSEGTVEIKLTRQGL